MISNDLTTGQTSQEKIFQPTESLLPYFSLKAKQIALSFFAGLFFAVGLISLATLSAGIFTAIPSFALGVGCIWLISRIKAYDDPRALKQYRDNALKQPLTKTIKIHGWKNLTQHKIISKENFSRLFVESIQNMTIKEGVLFWQETRQAQKTVKDPFIIPGSIIFSEKWKTEVQDMEVTQVLDTYDVKKYIRLGFAHPELGNAIISYEKAIQNCSYDEFEKINQDYKQYLSEDVPPPSSN